MKIPVKLKEPDFVAKWKKFFFPRGGDPTRTMTRVYMLALGIIAVLTISNHFIVSHITSQQKDSAELAYLIGRQRAVLQQVVMYAGNYDRLGERLDYDFMKQNLWDLDKGHEFLAQTIGQKNLLLGHKSEALYRIYFKPPFNLDEHVKEFHGLIEQYAEFSPGDQNPARAELIKSINSKAESVLRPAMDAALENYQSEILDKIVRYYNIQFGSALFILIVLAAEALLIFRPMVGKIKEYNTALQRLALEDTLTGLNNRRAFMKGSENELTRSRREKTPVTVALLDLDHFKKVNDTYGHEVGDRVLQHFSGILKKSFRASDITGRIGGEEFAILLPRIDHEGAKAILQRLCDTAAATPCPYKDSSGQNAELRYTVSIGYTGPSVVQNETIDELLAKADLGLYGAKEKGRNCVVSMDNAPAAQTVTK